MPGASLWPRVTSFCLRSTSKKGKRGLGSPHKSEWKQTKMCHQLWGWHGEEQIFTATNFGRTCAACSWLRVTNVVVLHPRQWKKNNLHCHIFPPSSVGELKSITDFSSSKNCIFVILSLVICCLHQSFLFHDRPLMGAFSVFHFVPYRCKTLGIFTSNLEE